MSNLYSEISSDFYDEIYFELGSIVGKSGYSYYRWMPEPTFRMAMAIIEYTGLARNELTLDFGCAKGYLVKAMRYLFREAYGCDCSRYAIACADADIKDYLKLSMPEQPVPFEMHFELCIAKDVLEHIPPRALPHLLQQIRQRTNKLLTIVPLGDGNRYYIEQYENDKSHFIRENVDWWTASIEKAGFSILSMDYHVQGIKDSWYKVNPRGNVIILAK